MPDTIEFEEEEAAFARCVKLGHAKLVVDCLKSLGDDISDYGSLHEARSVLQALALAVLAELKARDP
jgi:hypothetical protein